VSVKAVEYHLPNVYGKLGINARYELRQHLAAT
jgi:DNA-binding CsgD family transcriptional regulator